MSKSKSVTPLSPDEEQMIGYDGLLDEVDALIAAYRAAKLELGITKSDIARILRRDRSWVSRVLGGKSKNVTVRTLALLYHAMEHKKVIRQIPLWREPARNTSHYWDMVADSDQISDASEAKAGTNVVKRSMGLEPV